MDIFLLLTIGVVTASVFGLLARIFKQPVLVGYLFAGLALSVFGALTAERQDILDSLAHFGITFLLFLVGLEMNLKELKTVGKVAVIAGISQIVFTSAVGFLLSRLLGFDFVASLYIAIALTFSSTIIIVKLLSEKRDLSSLYGKIAVGFLPVQDVVAILILMVLSGIQSSEFGFANLALIFAKGASVVFGIYLVSRFVLTKLFDRIARASGELLFISSVAWALFVASLVSSPWFGFSVEIGGFLAGLALARSSEHFQIASRIKPLRDFFLTIFFLLLGAKLAVGLDFQIIVPAILLSLFVLIGNPLIVMSILGLMGYKKRTSFLASVTVAQISEFSFTIIWLGERVNHVSSQVVSLTILVGIITMTVSTYLILYGHIVYEKFKNFLSIFEKKNVKENALSINKEFSNHLVLLGCHRLGSRVLPILLKRQEEVVVVDFNPQIVEKLVADGVSAFYGDTTDAETLDLLNLKTAKMVISTTGSLEDNLFVLEFVSKFEKRPLMVFSAGSAPEALVLYEKGADYVIVPHIAGGDHLAHILNTHGLAREYFKKAKLRHFDRLAQERF